jgi:hypothetical protein
LNLFDNDASPAFNRFHITYILQLLHFGSMLVRQFALRMN